MTIEPSFALDLGGEVCVGNRNELTWMYSHSVMSRSPVKAGGHAVFSFLFLASRSSRGLVVRVTAFLQHVGLVDGEENAVGFSGFMGFLFFPFAALGAVVIACGTAAQSHP
jgi:hypothetical protein